jgi:hypothetical protein
MDTQLKQQMLCFIAADAEDLVLDARACRVDLFHDKTIG